MSYDTDMTPFAEQVKAYLDVHSPIKELRTDYANSDALEQFIAIFPEVYWCQDTGVLLIGNDVGTYDEDRGDSMLAKLMNTFNMARLAWANEQECQDRREEDARDAFVKHVNKTRELTYERNMINSFKQRREIKASELNQSDEYIGVPGGILDLADGTLLHDEYYYTGSPVNFFWDDDGNYRPYRHQDGYDYKITKHTGTALYPHLEERFPAEEWLRFIDEITCHDHDLADFLQRAIGYSLMKGNPQAVMFICYGPTSRNGKTVLFNTVMRALGDYAMQVNSQFLCDNKSDANGTNDELARLVGKRMVYMAEPSANSTLSDSKVKSYTGNDMISTSRKFGPNFTFYPEFTMYMACNDLPNVEDNSIFLSERVIIIPFNRHFTREERDVNLEREFAEDEIQMGVLQWVIDGLQMYQERGLEMPEAVKKANESYREYQQNPLDRFLYEYAKFDVDGRWETVDFMKMFRGYCTLIEKNPYSAQEVTKCLQQKGVGKRKSNGKRYYVGVEVKNVFSECELEAALSKLEEESNKDEKAKTSLPSDALKKGLKTPKDAVEAENDEDDDSFLNGTILNLG